MPSGLLRRGSGSRAGGRAAWVRADATAPGRDRGETDGGGSAARLRALGPCAPRTLCESKWLGSEFGGTPRPVPRGGGRSGEAGGGSGAGGREAASAGGGRGGGGSARGSAPSPWPLRASD